MRAFVKLNHPIGFELLEGGHERPVRNGFVRIEDFDELLLDVANGQAGALARGHEFGAA